MFQKEKRKGCCTYSWPVSVPCLWTSWCQSLGVGLFGFFLGSFFLLFVFSLSFSLGFSIQTRYLSSIVSLDTFAHAHSPKSAGSKCQKKFGTIYHFDINLMWSRWVNRGHLVSCQIFKRPLCKKVGHTAKNGQRYLSRRFSRCSCLFSQ